MERFAFILLTIGSFSSALGCGGGKFDAAAEDADGGDDASDGGDDGCDDDADLDGYTAMDCGGDDCDDADPSIHPFAVDDVEGEWTEALVDAEVTQGPRGTRPLLIQSPDGTVHAYYFAEANGSMVLRHAAYSEQAWAHENLFTGPLTGMGAAIDSKGMQHVAYVGDELPLVHAFNSGGSWEQESLVAAEEVYAAGIDLAVDERDEIHVCFVSPLHESGYRDLLYRSNRHGAWETEVALIQVSSETDAFPPSCDLEILPGIIPGMLFFWPYVSNQTGYVRFDARFGWYDATNWNGDYFSLAMDDQARPHVVYRGVSDAENGPLIYVGEDVDFLASTIAHDVVAASPIVIDGSGNDHVVYSTESRLWHATRDGAWAFDALDAEATGDIALAYDTAGALHIIYVDAGGLQHLARNFAPPIDQDCDGHEG